eukprot:15353767-Ditylum_brightwellii.AAC.1
MLPITINANDTIIQSGPDGSKMSTSVLLGGSRHFEIAESVLGIELKGLTFISATNVSVGALGLSNASATFDYCEWAGQNVGTANVLIYNGDGSSLCG